MLIINSAEEEEKIKISTHKFTSNYVPFNIFEMKYKDEKNIYIKKMKTYIYKLNKEKNIYIYKNIKNLIDKSYEISCLIIPFN